LFQLQRQGARALGRVPLGAGGGGELRVRGVELVERVQVRLEDGDELLP
jgi:hypothetical protein